MAFSLRSFASGDTDYVAKLNNNDNDIVNAILALQAAVGGGGGGASIALLLLGLFGDSAACLLGIASYAPSTGGSNLTLQPGYSWKP